MKSLIQNQEQFEKFKSILPALERDEIYFVSLSARNKYLTEEERKLFELGKTEMFSRQTAYDKDGIDYAIKKLEASLEYKKTRNGQDFPDKSLVCYFNINPSSTIKAFNKFKSEMNAQFEQAYRATINYFNYDFRVFHRIERNLLNAIQKSPGRKYYIDIDFDVKDDDAIKEFSSLLKSVDVSHYIIKTKSGFHCLIVKHTINNSVNNNIFKKIKELHLTAQKYGGEVKINSNSMVPFPGTLQGGHLVEIVKL